MEERIFVDKTGEELIVQYRRSAVFFCRETDLSIEGYVSPIWTDSTPIIHPTEMNRRYHFSEQTFQEFIDYMERISQELWKDFAAKDADSMGSDYADYYDKEFDSEGSLSLSKNILQLDGPNQDKTNKSIVRLYKFNKRKFESFIYDLRKIVGA